ncbi:MAG: hypothetical protein IJ776_00860 [Paludibacteraceae bacterium]|nr:hypothetical protein [Paludibacteraceae bacterium]
MAKADLEVPFNSIRGSLDSESEIYYANRLGATVVSHYPKRKDPKKITAHQHDLNNNFRQAVAQATIELTDPQRRANWQEQFNAQKEPKRYKTLRGYIIAKLTNQISNENN